MGSENLFCNIHLVMYYYNFLEMIKIRGSILKTENLFNVQNLKEEIFYSIWDRKKRKTDKKLNKHRWPK